MNIEELKRTINDLEFVMGRLESFENIGEVADQLKELTEHLRLLKKSGFKTFFTSVLVGLLIGALIGIFTIKTYQDYKTKAIQDFKNIGVYQDDNSSYLYIPKTDFYNRLLA